MKDEAPKKFLVSCLGCKVNQAEVAWLAGELELAGWQRVSEPEQAQVAVLFTCSVTAAAGRQSRQAARRLTRANPDLAVYAAGCDAQLTPDSYRKEGLAVAPRASLAQLPTLLLDRAQADQGPALPAPDSGEFCPGARAPLAGRTRALLKVQDGCDANCAYCTVPLARGAPRSLPPDRAEAAFAALGAAGAAEVVLTGIHLGLYGRGLEPGQDLPHLLRRLLAAHPGPRIRISSLEVGEVSHEIIDLLAATPRLCPHLHLPLQTGSDRLLKSMGRPYTRDEYAAAIRLAAEKAPGLCLGADVLVGLPGEDQEAFEETRALLADLPISYLHVFAYSPRPGTRAASMPGRPAGREVKRRSQVLRKLAASKQKAFYAAQVGRELLAVVEAGDRGRSANYCSLLLPAGLAVGSLVPVVAKELVTGPEGLSLRCRPL